MKRLRLRIFILASWLIFWGFTDSFLGFNALGKITIGFAFVVFVALFLFPRMLVSPLLVVLVPITALLVTIYWLGDLSLNVAVYLAIVQACVMMITMVIARWVNTALIEFEDVVADITLGPRDKKLASAPLDQSLIYREVRRARNHQRPLALISIRVDPNSFETESERMVQETQRLMMNQYKFQLLSKILCAELEDCSVIAQDTDHYLAVLPETLPNELPFVIERLRQKAYDHVGVNLKIGFASLPHDSYTFEGLIEKANREMEMDQDLQPNILLDQNVLESQLDS